LQPLDVSIFKPFKTTFRACRDQWIVEKKGKATRKEELAKWVSKGLRKALTRENIKKGFSTSGIWPLQPTTVVSYMKPSACYNDLLDNSGLEAELDMDCLSGIQTQGPHFFVEDAKGTSQNSRGTDYSDGEDSDKSASQKLFPLPRIERPK